MKEVLFWSLLEPHEDAGWEIQSSVERKRDFCSIFTCCYIVKIYSYSWQENTYWLRVKLWVFRENHLPQPFLYHSILQTVMISKSFCEDFSWHKPVSLISPLFVPLSRVAYVPAPPSSLPGGGVGTSCAPFLTEKRMEEGYYRSGSSVIH